MQSTRIAGRIKSAPSYATHVDVLATVIRRAKYIQWCLAQVAGDIQFAPAANAIRQNLRAIIRDTGELAGPRQRQKRRGEQR